jgi:hypothetical protein
MFKKDILPKLSRFNSKLSKQKRKPTSNKFPTDFTPMDPTVAKVVVSPQVTKLPLKQAAMESQSLTLHPDRGPLEIWSGKIFSKRQWICQLKKTKIIC